MTYKHKIIRAKHQGITLGNYDNYESDYSFNNGESITDQKKPIPSPLIAKIKKNPVDIPENKAVYDFIWGLCGGLKVSARVKQLFESEGVNAEYIPLEIIDEESNKVEGEFYTVKVLEKHEIFDLDKYTPGLGNDQIFVNQNTKLIAKDEGEYTKHQLVIPAHLKSRLAMREDLIQKIEAAKLTNLEVIEFENYHG